LTSLVGDETPDSPTPARPVGALAPGPSRLCGAEVVAAVIHQFASNFLLNEVVSRPIPSPSEVPPSLMIPGFVPRRRDDEEEMLHQARVSLRRMRSTLRIFESLLDAEWSRGLSELLVWYGGILGAARDLTVLRGKILDEDLPIRSAEVRVLLSGTLNRELDRAMRDKDAARLSPQYFALLDQFIRIDEQISYTPLGYGSARRVLVSQLDAPYRELNDAVTTARKEMSAENLHAVRIRAKRLQHGCEAVSLVEGKRVHRTARASEALQRRLGLVHDATVAESWLRDLAGSEPDHSHHLLQLAEWERVAAREHRRGWRDDVRTLRSRWRRWH
jgi:CHAD domain-containing protein